MQSVRALKCLSATLLASCCAVRTIRLLSPPQDLTHSIHILIHLGLDATLWALFNCCRPSPFSPLVGSPQSRPGISQDTFTPLAPVRPAPQPPGSDSPPDIPPRPAATKKGGDYTPTPTPKVPLKPPLQSMWGREGGREGGRREGGRREGERKKGGREEGGKERGRREGGRKEGRKEEEGREGGRTGRREGCIKGQKDKGNTSQLCRHASERRGREESEREIFQLDLSTPSPSSTHTHGHLQSGCDSGNPSSTTTEKRKEAQNDRRRSCLTPQ